MHFFVPKSSPDPLCRSERPALNADGNKKQDWEIKAGKRMVAKNREQYPRLPMGIVGDGPYSKQPFADAPKKAHMSYILVAEPDDHKVLFEWFNGVPLNGTPEADNVNFFQYVLIPGNKIPYRNRWVTDMAVGEHNVVEKVNMFQMLPFREGQHMFNCIHAPPDLYPP